jgi:hypothetical protein
VSAQRAPEKAKDQVPQTCNQMLHLRHPLNANPQMWSKIACLLSCFVEGKINHPSDDNGRSSG